MTNPTDTGFEADPAILTAFVRAVATAGDSPTVISRVAENARYPDLCRRIVALDAAQEAPPPLQEACRQAEITPARLRARLTPVAQALRLVPAAPEGAYYEVLGVAPGSNAKAIRRAYRQKARDLHPDLRPARTVDHQAFTTLTEAYDTLRDPEAREAYDTRQSVEATWYEPDPQVLRRTTRPRRPRFTAVIVVVLLLVAAALVLDQLDRARVRRSAYQASQHRVILPVPPPAPVSPRPAEASPAVVPPEPNAAPRSDPLQPELSSAAGPLLAGSVHDLSPLPASAPTAQEIPSPEKPLSSTPEAGVGISGRADPGHTNPPTGPTLRLAIFHSGADGGRLAAQLAAHLSANDYPRARVGPTPEPLIRPSNIRYFNTADRDAARTLRAAVQAFLSTRAPYAKHEVRLTNLARRYPRREPGLLEIWLNAGTTAATVPDGKAAAPLRSKPAVAAIPPTAAGAPAPPTEAGIQTFIGDYCRRYESRDPDRLAALFDPAATENGRPFQDMLPRYRDNMARFEQLSYRIELARWKARSETASPTVAVEGRFTAEGRTADQQHYRSQGTITLDIVPHGTSYRVVRLAYEIEKRGKSD